MKKIISRLLAHFFLIYIASVTPTISIALPIQLDGEKLPSLAPMLERVTPGVVNIATEGKIQLQQNPLFNDPFFRRFFEVPNQPLERKTSSLGSGVIVDAERGLVLTNNHVISNAHQITVTLRDGRQLEAEVVGTDPETDVAVIKVPADNLTVVKTTNSDELKVGDFVVAIGNPFGLGQTVTSGIVSALGRSGLGIEGYEDFIQTDASINPGNSGGALVNLRGELIGINTAIIAPNGGGNVGIGLAIPMNLALRVMEQIIETGEVKRGFLGVSIQDLSPALAEAFGLESQQGTIINEVMVDSPADKAGLRAGDVVISIDDKKIKNSADLKNRIGLLPVGKKIKFRILRDGKEINFVIKVEEKSFAATMPKVANELLKGVTLSEIKEGHPTHGRVAGIMVIDVQRGSAAWRGGLRANDIITSVNKTQIEDMAQFLKAVNNQNDSLLLRIIRGNVAAFLVLKK